jgi:hypothetical protein
MAYGDRMTLRIKDFGRKVVIDVHRGQIQPPQNNKVTIVFSRPRHRAPSRRPA